MSHDVAEPVWAVYLIDNRRHIIRPATVSSRVIDGSYEVALKFRVPVVAVTDLLRELLPHIRHTYQERECHYARWRCDSRSQEPSILARGESRLILQVTNVLGVFLLATQATHGVSIGSHRVTEADLVTPGWLDDYILYHSLKGVL